MSLPVASLPPDDTRKLVLHAGEYYFGGAGMQVHTLLGSCIAITLWHPQRLIGGICHFALARPETHPLGPELDPRYAEDCIALFKRSVEKHNTRICDYQAKIFGGGNMYEKYPADELPSEQKQPIGEKNSAAAFSLLLAEKADIRVAHVGEFGYRRIVFNIATGDVWVKFKPASGAVGNVVSLDGRT